MAYAAPGQGSRGAAGVRAAPRAVSDVRAGALGAVLAGATGRTGRRFAEGARLVQQSYRAVAELLLRGPGTGAGEGQQSGSGHREGSAVAKDRAHTAGRRLFGDRAR